VLTKAGVIRSRGHRETTSGSKALSDLRRSHRRRGFGRHRQRCGLDLETKLEKAVVAIRRHPESWPRNKDTVFHKFFLERFPYIVFNLDLADCIWIVAVAHGSRRLDYWHRRKRD
jgi:toxin ParE1/3/4